MTHDDRRGHHRRGLARAGATHAFGIPGGEVLALMQGLDAAGLRFVLVKHENGGGFMAEGLWHMTGALPVLVATLGPGVANAVNVVANAMQDRVPLIFLTGCVDAAEAETYTHQVFDHQAMLRPVVKGSFRLAAGAVGAGMAKAIALATSGQPGPVHVDVPIGVAEAVADRGCGRGPLGAAPGLPAAAGLAGAGRAEGAKRPLAIAGVDAVNEGAGPAIAAFCRAHHSAGHHLQGQGPDARGRPAVPWRRGPVAQGRPHPDAADRAGRLRSFFWAMTRSRCASAGATPLARTRP
jgi:acetolactate synthase I/II/III large subunit